MRSRPTLSTKLLAMGAGCLLVALASIGLTLWVTWKLEGGAAAVNEAGRLRMNMLRMVLVLQTEPPEAVQERARQFDASLELLRTGDPSRPLFVPWSDETRTRFDGIRARWAEARTGWVSALPPDRARNLAEADAFVQQVDGFVDAIESQIAGWTAALPSAAGNSRTSPNAASNPVACNHPAQAAPGPLRNCGRSSGRRTCKGSAAGDGSAKAKVTRRGILGKVRELSFPDAVLHGQKSSICRGLHRNPEQNSANPHQPAGTVACQEMQALAADCGRPTGCNLTLCDSRKWPAPRCRQPARKLAGPGRGPVPGYRN